jgi:DNA-binding NarL/FixJ family response regulator
MPVRVVIVCRRLDVRRALQIRLALERDVTVSGSASSVEAALPSLRGQRAEVLLVDLDGSPALCDEVLRRARSAMPGLRVVLLTHHREACAAASLSADDVIDKDADAGPLLEAIRGRAQGFV